MLYDYGEHRLLLNIILDFGNAVHVHAYAVIEFDTRLWLGMDYNLKGTVTLIISCENISFLL